NVMSGPFTSPRGDRRSQQRNDKKNPRDNTPPFPDYDYDDLDAAKSQLDKNLKELAQSYQALDDVVSDASVASMFVDLDMKVRDMSASARRHFNLSKSDHGLPVSVIAQRLNYPSLIDQTRSVLQHSGTVESDIHLADGRH